VSRQRGFTLIEVMVGVAILGLAVTMLARSAIQGMSYEGDASRRLRASLIADRTLAQVETALKLGTPPPLGHQESQEADEYQLTLDVQPLDLAQAGLGALLAPPPGQGEAAPAAAALAPAAPLPLYTIQIRVGWVEGLAEQSVTRTTFAYDASAALQALGAANGENAQQEQEPQEREGEPPPEEETE
jgi:prepilin-type N-terminal cleavage/methylation domain-containing protein